MLTGTQPLRPDQLDDAEQVAEGKKLMSEAHSINGKHRRDAARIKAENKTKIDSQSDDLDGTEWCNGRCDGRVDTSRCTIMCVEIWQRRL